MANYNILMNRFNGTSHDTLLPKNHLEGTSDPTTSTVGIVGQFYLNTASTPRKLFQCINVVGSVYTWERIYKGEETVQLIETETQPIYGAINAGWQLLWSRITAGSGSWVAPDLNNGKPYKVGVLIIGGGGSGASSIESNSSGSLSGGASGYMTVCLLTLTPGQTYSYVVGAGGVDTAHTKSNSTGGGAGSGEKWTGTAGGASSFNSISVLGGEGGKTDGTSSSSGGQRSVYSTSSAKFYGGAIPTLLDTGILSILAYNPFLLRNMLGAGGSVVASSSAGGATSAIAYGGGKDTITGLGGGNGVAIAHKSPPPATYTATGNPGTEPGSGGGAVTVARYYDNFAGSGTITVTAGAGAPGAVYIYAQGVKV